jgi:hypothetical protein
MSNVSRMRDCCCPAPAVPMPRAFSSRSPDPQSWSPQTSPHPPLTHPPLPSRLSLPRSTSRFWRRRTWRPPPLRARRRPLPARRRWPRRVSLPIGARRGEMAVASGGTAAKGIRLPTTRSCARAREGVRPQGRPPLSMRVASWPHGCTPRRPRQAPRPCALAGGRGAPPNSPGVCPPTKAPILTLSIPRASLSPGLSRPQPPRPPPPRLPRARTPPMPPSSARAGEFLRTSPWHPRPLGRP